MLTSGSKKRQRSELLRRSKGEGRLPYRKAGPLTQLAEEMPLKHRDRGSSPRWPTGGALTTSALFARGGYPLAVHVVAQVMLLPLARALGVATSWLLGESTEGGEMPENIVVKARVWATQLHEGQLYGGLPYIVHPERVAQRVAAQGGTPAMEAAAWLHDAVEDGHTTLAEIAARCGAEVAALVEVLSRRPGETYRVYIARVGADATARQIKLADLEENAINPPAGLARRYRTARAYLRALEGTVA